MVVSNIQNIVYCIMEEEVMKQSLMERLEILESADLIDADVFAFCEKVVNYFLENTSEWPQEITTSSLSASINASARSIIGATVTTFNIPPEAS